MGKCVDACSVQIKMVSKRSDDGTLQESSTVLVLVFVVLTVVPPGSPSRGGDVMVCVTDIN